jgi:hypothetical protein
MDQSVKQTSRMRPVSEEVSVAPCRGRGRSGTGKQFPIEQVFLIELITISSDQFS